QSSGQDDETAADFDRATRPRANVRFNPDWQPVRLCADGELGAQELFESGSEAEREAGEAVIRGGDMRGTGAARQKRSKTLYFGDDELAGEVRVKLVQCDVSERRAREAERGFEPQRRGRLRPADLDQGEVVEPDSGRQSVALGIFQSGLSLRVLVPLNVES